MTEQEWDDLKDRELDDSLNALFKSTGAPTPLPGFASRTMKAVRREPLPAGRRRLRHPLVVPIGWAALITAATGAATAVVIAHPPAAELFASGVTAGVRGGIWLLHSVTMGIAWPDVLTAVGRAVALGIATQEGSAGVLLMIATAGLSLTALLRLLEFDSSTTLERTQPWQDVQS